MIAGELIWSESELESVGWRSNARGLAGVKGRGEIISVKFFFSGDGESFFFACFFSDVDAKLRILDRLLVNLFMSDLLQVIKLIRRKICDRGFPLKYR